MIQTVIFSRDRACQLDLLLRSIKQHAPMLERPVVLWKASHVGFQMGYRILAGEHPDVHMVQETSFADDLRLLVGPHAGPLACFLVDDDVVFRPVGFDAARLLEDQEILAFSLRLGWNTTFCYPLRQRQPNPTPLRTPDSCCVWDWTTAAHDYGYPASLDGHVMRSSDVVGMLSDRSPGNPNELEDVLAMAARTPAMMRRRPLMASYRSSVLVGVPANVVTTTHANRNSAEPEFSSRELNRRYVGGERVSLDGMDFSHVNAAHCEIPYVIA